MSVSCGINGQFVLCLTSKIPFTLLSVLLDLLKLQSDVENPHVRKSRIDRLRNSRTESVFKSPMLDDIVVDIQVIERDGQTKNCNAYDVLYYVACCNCNEYYIDMGNMDYSVVQDYIKKLRITNVKNVFKQKNFECIVVAVKMDTNRYSESFVKDFVTLFAPYLGEEQPQKIGFIANKDWSRQRTLFLEDDLFEEIMLKKKYVCEGCKNYRLTFDCNNWDFCKRAFERGKKSK